MTGLLKPLAQACRTSMGLLLLRLLVGVALMIHGFGKIQNPTDWLGPNPPFPPALLAVAAFAEFGGGLLWILGLLTPLASLFIAGTMGGAIHFHAILKGDPFISAGGKSYELAAVYLCVALVLLLAGPGRYSLDRLLFGEQPTAS